MPTMTTALLAPSSSSTNDLYHTRENTWWRRICTDTSSNCRCRLGDLLEKYTDLISSVTILAVDIIFLIGETVPGFPPKITNVSFFTLNFIGLVSLNFQASLLHKTIGDFALAKKTRNQTILISSAAKVVYIASGIILTVSGCVASITRMTHHNDITDELYSISRPWGVSSIVLGIGIDFFEYFTNKSIIGQLKNGLSDVELHTIKHLFTSPSIALPENTFGSQEAAYIRGRMDKDTWRKFSQDIQLIEDNNIHKIKGLISHVALKNIETQQFVAKANIVLHFAGDVGMAVADLYPGTAIQAGIITTFSSLYTTKLIIQKVQQAKQRNESSQILENEVLSINQV
ncbi:MAG: hypothetical protein ACI9S8_001573 [Chlamydiales bacterium]|jgi:hypothetical protein